MSRWIFRNHVAVVLSLVLTGGSIASLQSVLAAAGIVAKIDTPALDAKIDATVATRNRAIDVSVWVGSTEGKAFYERASSPTMPTASAVKTFYLVEFFVDRFDALDDPVPAADAVLDDDDHPAISHFSPEQKVEIRRALKGRTARQLGKIMMGSAPASNAAYNVAANLITAVLGGPKELTARIHGRDPAFSDVHVRRYMLRDRTVSGDNEAPAQALADLYRKLATHSLPGVDRKTSEAIRGAIVRTETPSGAVTYVKTGSLSSDPLTRVEAGWQESNQGAVVFVVMMRQAAVPAGQSRTEDSEALGEACRAVREALLEAVSIPAGD